LTTHLLLQKSSHEKSSCLRFKPFNSKFLGLINSGTREHCCVTRTPNYDVYYSTVSLNSCKAFEYNGMQYDISVPQHMVI